MAKKRRLHKINEEIRGAEVRVGADGVLSVDDALALAKERGMDLVLMNPKPVPPICTIMNYEKFIYEQGKKPKHKTPELKEIKLGPNTADNDLDYRQKQIVKFLGKGHKVKITLQFRGREITHVDKGKALMLKLIVALEDHGIPDSMPKMEGKKMVSIIRPNK